MGLFTQLQLTVTSWFRPWNTAAERVDQRESTRFPSDKDTHYQTSDDSNAPRLPALIENVSHGGLGLRVHQKHPIGHLLHVEVPRATKPRSENFVMCVRHVAEADDNAYILGCSFIRELNDREIQSFL